MRVRRVTIQLIFMMLLTASTYAQHEEEKARIYEPLFAAAAARYDIDPRLLWTIAHLESRFRQHAVSYKDGRPCAYGLMQFLPSTAQRYRLKDPLDPVQSIDAAARYVRDLEVRFGGRGELVLAAYNAGEGTVEAFRDGRKLVLRNGKVINPNGIQTGGVPPYRETRDYVANGRIIYERISRAGLFQPRLATTPGARPLTAVGEREPNQDSIYILEFDENRSEEREISSNNKHFQRQSLYPH